MAYRYSSNGPYRVDGERAPTYYLNPDAMPRRQSSGHTSELAALYAPYMSKPRSSRGMVNDLELRHVYCDISWSGIAQHVAALSVFYSPPVSTASHLSGGLPVDWNCGESIDAREICRGTSSRGCGSLKEAR